MRLDDIATPSERSPTARISERMVPQALYYGLLPNHRMVRTLGDEQPPRLSCQIAFVFTHMAILDPGHPLFEPLLRSARAHAALLGADVVSLAPPLESRVEDASLERWRTAGVDGIVVFGGSDEDSHVLHERWPNLPVVVVEDTALGPRSAEVTMDNETSFEQVVHHLWEQGRRRIATITGLLGARPARERLAGYTRALDTLGAGVDPDYVEGGDWSPDSGYRATRRLLQLMTPPDAIACACDVQAVGALCALEEAGFSCPEDIAVTGFDDAPFAASVVPSLTSVRQPAAAMGIAAIDALAAMIADPELRPARVVEQGQLVVRESSTRRFAR